MKNHQHCNICKHVDARLFSGIFCGLTEQRPDFINSCMSFKLDSYRKYELKELRIELEYLESKRKRFNSRFYFMLFIGTIIIVLGIYLFMVSPKSRFGIELSAFISGIGFMIWTAALMERSKLLRHKHRVLNKIDAFEEVLQYYKL